MRDLYLHTIGGTSFVLRAGLIAALLLGTLTAIAEATPIKIMPLGDSLTNGTGDKSGFRSKLYADLTAAGVPVDFVGSLSTNSSAGLPDPDHEGHPGFNIDNIANGWSSYPGVDTWLNPAVCDPDIILLLIGTNDVSERSYHDFTHAPDRLDSLISRISSKTSGLQPDAHMIVAKIPPRADSGDESATQWYNTELVTIVQQHIALGENISLVDMHTPLTVSDLSDGVHLTQAGYDKVAGVWYDGIMAVIPEPCSLAIFCLGAGLIARGRRRRA